MMSTEDIMEPGIHEVTICDTGETEANIQDFIELGEIVQETEIVETNGVEYTYNNVDHETISDVQNLPVESIETSPKPTQLKCPRSKHRKARRYWNNKEEQILFEIWGRENWRLPKHGKNTPYFAEWVVEFKDKYNMDIKLEEIQCKVNQTRAKYR